MGRIGRHTDNAQLALGLRQVDIVESGAAQGHELDTILHQGIDDLGADLIVDENTDNLLALRQFDGVHRQTLLVIMYVETEVLVPHLKRVTIVAVSIEESYFCHSHKYLWYFLCKDKTINANYKTITAFYLAEKAHCTIFAVEK